MIPETALVRAQPSSLPKMMKSAMRKRALIRLIFKNSSDCKAFKKHDSRDKEHASGEEPALQGGRWQYPIDVSCKRLDLCSRLLW